ncbi:MAG TPA: hypothetical protein VHQ43_08620 [Solirubrobacterales bacterium]|jgi:hypothetical protein|nr:hypothetical protein [Solirubrobacterales bacterium]
MAGGERRMVFDTRGRRKHVVRVVYAILALLMGTSLFLVIGPVNVGSLIGNQTSSGSSAQVFEEQAERIEGRLAKHPTDEGMLLSLTRARIGAGSAQLESSGAGETQLVTPEAQGQFEAALSAWNRYLKQAGDEPSPSAAQLIANTYFKLAEGSSSYPEAELNVSTAAKAQAIAAEQRPSYGTLSTLAIYQYFNGEFAAGDSTLKRAVAEAPSKAEGKSIEKQIGEYRKQAEKYNKQKKQNEKLEKQAGKESLANPFGSLGGSGGGGE